MTSFSKALEISNNYYAGPTFLIKNNNQEIYQQKTSTAYLKRVGIVLFAFFDGITKPVVVPIYVCVGIIAFPIIALLVKAGIGKSVFHETPKEYLKAWAFSLLFGAGILSLLYLTAGNIPLLGTAVIVIVAFTVSLIAHIVIAARAPKPPKELEQPPNEGKELQEIKPSDNAEVQP